MWKDLPDLAMRLRENWNGTDMNASQELKGVVLIPF